MHTIIVGGGFAGVKAALELSKLQIGKVTLISDEPFFTHHATLYATATGKSKAESIIPLAEIFAGSHNVTIVHDMMKSIDPDRKLVVGDKKDYSYDKLVIAIGSVTTFFGIDGMAKHAYGIKSLSEINSFTTHIKSEISDNKHLDRNYFIIGAGPTGIELAGALYEYLTHIVSVDSSVKGKVNVTIVEAAPRIIPRSSGTAAHKVGARLKRLGIKVLVNHKVGALSGDTITIDGKPVATETAIWTSGVANHPFFAAHAQYFQLAPNGRVNVNQYLEAYRDIFVIGDNNTVKFVGMAWPALDQGKYIARHIARLATKRPTKSFKPHQPPAGIPVGKGWGFVEWHGIYVSGRAGYVARRLMELYGYTQLVPLRVAIDVWRAHDVPEIDV
jgi:NADH:ubiquinone reductase (H+-translocating)